MALANRGRPSLARRARRPARRRQGRAPARRAPIERRRSSRRVDFRSVHATGPARFGVKPGGDRQLKLPARAALKLLIMYWDEIDHGILLLLGRLPLR